MNSIEPAISRMEQLATEAENPNWVDSHDVLDGMIELEERMDTIHKGQTVLDLGSGNGSAAFVWANSGYSTIGIELDPALHRIAVDSQRRYPELSKLNVRFFNGSYYPQGYEKTERTRRLENRILRDYRSARQYFAPIKDTIYEDNGIDLKDVDIFYAYLWSFQFPSVFEMFSVYARDDARLIAVGPERDIILTHYPNLKKEYNTIRKA